MGNSGADPEINCEGQVGGAQGYEYNYEGRRRVHNSIALCNKMLEEGVHVPPMHPPGSATGISEIPLSKSTSAYNVGY